MIKHLTYDEDLAIKKYSSAPSDEKPRFDWKEVVLEEEMVQPKIKVLIDSMERDFDLAEVADTIGEALTNLLLSRQEKEIFTEANRSFVAASAKGVADRLIDQTAGTGPITLSAHDLHLLIEKSLIDHDAHDVARSLVFERSRHVNLEPVDIRLIRRNGLVVPWDQNKVEVAVRKAFLSLELNSDPAVAVARSVTTRLRDTENAFINIEDVQDLVQEELMRQGHFKAAEAYILYRAHHARLREQAAQAAADDERQGSMVVVARPDGSTFFWDGSDLRKRIDFSVIGLNLCLSKDDIEAELRRSLFAEMTLDSLRKTVILNAKALIEKDADFAKFAGRILLTYIYEEVLGWDIVQDGFESLKSFHIRGFKRYIDRGIEIERLHPRLKEFALDRLADALDPSADLDFDYLGVQTLYDRYLIVDKTGPEVRRMETPQIFWMRVAMGLFTGESAEREAHVIGLYSLYKARRFCSSTPTLFNSGTLHSQLSSCYLYKVDDNIESIMLRGIAENAFLSKWAGGLGGSWTAVRGTGSYIKGTNGESQGVIPFLKLHNDQLVAVNQGGKRRGSGCAYLETWHNDIMDFLELRKNTGDDRRRSHDMNTANWIPDLFMKRMEAREHWTLFQSSDVPDLHERYGSEFEQRYMAYEEQARRGEIYGEEIKAIDLWRRMLTMLFETGHPWITFKDACNIRNPQDHVGVIHSSNLCTEITLNTSETETAVCNLGSIVLETHLNDDGTIDLPRLRDTIYIAVRALDNVIDINFYPTAAAKRSNIRHRPIGLGVMGLQNALYKRNICFASAEALEFNDEAMEAIAFYAYEASSDLALERGTYTSYEGSKWSRGLMPQDTLELLEEERGLPIEVPRVERMDWAGLRKKILQQGMHNSNVIAIAPTATISNIMGTSPCIEPAYKNLYVKSNLSGDFIVLNSFLVNDLNEIGLWDQDMLDNLKYFDGELTDIPGIPDELKRKYATAFDIDYNFLIDAAARRQKWIDQSQSVNLFLGDPDLKMLSHMYRAAWHKGLKTTYYLRTLGASNIEKATVGINLDKARSQTPVSASESQAKAGEEEAQACSIEAMMNGEPCESCQ